MKDYCEGVKEIVEVMFPSPSTASLDEMREVAARICRDYLHGAWKTIGADEIKFRRISGGLSNFLYYVSLPDTYDNNNSATTLTEQALKRVRTDSFRQDREPKEVLLRIYGQSHGETAMLTELVVFTLLSERNLGPKLHGIFPGGRIEQYIPARALKTAELSNNCISMKIAEKIAKIHTLNIPVSKEPEWIWKTMGRWLKNIDTIFESTKYDCSPKHREITNEMIKTDFHKEVKWLKSVIENSNYPVLFCHNDMQEGNILMKGSPAFSSSTESLSNEVEDSTAINRLQSGNSDLHLDEKDTNGTDNRDAVNGNNRKRSLQQVAETRRSSSMERLNNHIVNNIPELNDDLSNDSSDPELIIIDYEYCAYNYRGFDLANHFIEWTLDYTNKESPYFYHRKHQYPTIEQRDAFIVQYLRKYKNQDNYVPSREEMDDIIEEIHCFTMTSHLFWTLWSIINVHQIIEFGYWEYGLCRLREYHDIKNKYVASYMGKLEKLPK